MHGPPEATSDRQSKSSLKFWTALTLTIVETQQGHTRWFNVKDDELPVRVGVYEGSAHGVPGFHDNAFHHLFYRWDGERFSGSGGTPDEAHQANALAFPVAHWRGLVANGSVRRSLLRSPSSNRLAARVTPQHFGVRVEHLVVDSQAARFRFTTDASDPCTIEGEARCNVMGWYISTKLRVQGVGSIDPIYGAVLFAVEKQEGRRFLYGVWKQFLENDKTFSAKLGQSD